MRGVEGFGDAVDIWNQHRTVLSRLVTHDWNDPLKFDSRPVLSVGGTAGGAPDALGIVRRNIQPIRGTRRPDDVQVALWRTHLLFIEDLGYALDEVLFKFPCFCL